MNNITKVILLVIIIIVLIGISLVFTNITGNVVAKQGPFHVTKVIDGDTIVLADGEHVRLSGINTPEVGECYYAEAKSKTAELVFDKDIFLESDRTDRDRYDRLLRYIYVANISVNFLLVEQGYAIVYDKYKDDTKYYYQLKESETKAKDANIGVWACNASICPYVATNTSGKFYAADCKWAKRITAEHRICFNNTKEAEKAGFVFGGCNT